MKKKPTGLLKSLADLRKYESVVVGPVGEHLLAKRQLPSDRRQDIIHPSEVAKSDWCPRQTYYRIAGTPETNKGEQISYQLERIFEEGHDIHAKWQTWLGEMGRLWGTWKCRDCDYIQVGVGYFPCPDEKCGGRMEYEEVPLEAEEKYKIAGQADGALQDANALIEIKSIGMGTLRLEEPALLRKYRVETVDGKKIYDLDALWNGLKRPLSSHLKQTAIYLTLAREMGLPFDKVVFIYEYKATQAVKEFTVKYSAAIAAPLLDQALDVKYHLTRGTPVDRPEHTGLDTKVCRACPWMNECWGIDDKGRETQSGSESDQESGESGSVLALEARGRNPRVARRSHRARRQPVDESVHAADPVVGVRLDQAGGSGGRREVRRVRPRKT